MSAPLKQDARDFARDAFREDMANHQRRVGKMPTPRENDELLGQTLSEIENRRARRPIQPESKADVPEVSEADLHAAEAGYRILRGPDVSHSKIVKALTPMERQFAERMSARVQLLLAKAEPGLLGLPSWRDQVMAAMRTIHWCRENRQDDRRGFAELFKALEDSNASFGDWKKDPAKPLSVDYGAYSAKLKAGGGGA